MSLQDEVNGSAKSFFAVALVVDEGRGNFSFNPNQPCVVYHGCNRQHIPSNHP